MTSSIPLMQVKQYLQQLQTNICHQLSTLDGVSFSCDEWSSSLGTGRTRVIDEGNIIEKGGVNFSHVKGNRLPASATANRPAIANSPFEAMGISLVCHPRNPFVPTVHMNLRLFTASPANSEAVWWFGGGYDLTPYYGFDEDCIHWHTTAKAACDLYDPTLYRELRDWCHSYFFLTHRNEPRGIGGLFFDDLNRWDFDTSFQFLQSIGNSFCPAYLPIMERRHQQPYQDKHVTFQRIRRGRYVEFNLVHDRGTLFGLHTGGRTESILMSLPKHVQWHYDWRPEPDSEEARLTEHFLANKEWIS